MNLIETYNGSGFYAQYAESAVYDANGTPLTSYLTAVPAGTMNESAFSYDASDNITAYNGSAFKAGDEFPQSATDAIGYVTATSANIDSTINNVSANSGVWGGSALPISAGPGIKFEMVDNTLVASTDETVLFENQTNATADMILSEPLSNFDYFEMYGHWDYNSTQCIRAYNKIWTNSARGYNNAFSLAGYGVGNLASDNVDYFFCGTDYSANGTTLTVRKCMRNNLKNTLYSNVDGLIVDRIVGINKIAGE